MKHFFNITTIEEAKAAYRNLAKLNHPDKGGDLETMKAINVEYDFVCSKILKGENLSDADFNEAWSNSQLFKEKIDSIINLDNIIIEVCGLWLWVTGDTRNAKEVLKSNGFYWASKKLAWFWRPESAAGGRGKLDLDQVRNKYGSTVVSQSNYKRPAFVN